MCLEADCLPFLIPPSPFCVHSSSCCNAGKEGTLGRSPRLTHHFSRTGVHTAGLCSGPGSSRNSILFGSKGHQRRGSKDHPSAIRANPLLLECKCLLAPSQHRAAPSPRQQHWAQLERQKNSVSACQTEAHTDHMESNGSFCPAAHCSSTESVS